MSPLRGSNVIYHRVLRPCFLKHEEAIDKAVRVGAENISRMGDAVIEKGDTDR